MLNLYDILQEIISEDVSPKDVVDAIKNKYQVIITYQDEKSRATKKRLIEPYVYGLSKAGNSVFRAFQYDGDTFRGKPKWKLFRLDRVTSWMPTDSHFNASPKERGWNAEAYNENGDNSMSTVLNQVDLNSYDATSNNPYQKGSDLYNIRKRTDSIKQSSPININKMNNSNNGNVQNKTVDSFSNQKEFQNMLKRNLDITKKEKEKRGFSLQKNPSGPILNNNIEDANDSTDKQNNDNENFQNMLKRNLDITKKEKEKRGFSL
jgi:hypothetical protein